MTSESRFARGFHIASACISLNLIIIAICFNLIQEEKKYEEVEKEYETVAELAKEEEVELRYVYTQRTVVSFSCNDPLSLLLLLAYSFPPFLVQNDTEVC